MRSRSEILTFMNTQPLMVLSTLADGGSPQSAVVGFGQTDDLKIIFGTSSKSRKAQNILSEARVAIVIGWDTGGTLQYEGIACLLEQGTEATRYAEMYFAKTPSARKFESDPDEQYYLITPTWLRFSEEISGEWLTTELSF